MIFANTIERTQIADEFKTFFPSSSAETTLQMAMQLSIDMTQSRNVKREDVFYRLYHPLNDAAHTCRAHHNPPWADSTRIAVLQNAKQPRCIPPRSSKP